MFFHRPKVMGILNVTPDSFWDGSRVKTSEEIRQRIRKMIDEGADIIDIGGCSTRPGAIAVTPEEEYERLQPALEALRETDERITVSIDTFSSYVARRCVEEWNVNIVNDISGGDLDPEMWPLIAHLSVPYVLTHYGNRHPLGLKEKAVEEGGDILIDDVTSSEDITAKVIKELSMKVSELHLLGVNDVIIDPGFGFGKTTEDNLRMLNKLEEICRMGYPVLAGISRKSMISKTLGTDAENSLTGTIALNTVALMKGAHILRVHDVREAVETVKMTEALKN